MILTVNQLEEAAPYLDFRRLELILPSLNAACNKYDIINPYRIAHFLTQLIVETGYFRLIQEPGNGFEYEGSVDLGNIERGDGRRFIGRGYFKLIGRQAYTEYKKFSGTDVLMYPHFVTVPKTAMDVAGWIWQQKNLNQGADLDDLEGITIGLKGLRVQLRERQEVLKKVKRAIGI